MNRTASRLHRRAPLLQRRRLQKRQPVQQRCQLSGTSTGKLLLSFPVQVIPLLRNNDVKSNTSPLLESPLASPGAKRAKVTNSPGLLSRATSLESENLETRRALKHVFARIEAVENLRNAERHQVAALTRQSRLPRASALQLQSRVKKTEELLRQACHGRPSQEPPSGDA